MKKDLLTIALLIFFSGALAVYDIYLGASLVVENKDEILGYGQKAVSNTVAYGTTAVFEGFGKSFDHFEEKWDADYVRQLRNVDLEVKAMRKDSVDEVNDKVTVDLVFNNRNSGDDRLSLSHISELNYILIGDTSELYYPVVLPANHNTRYLPAGKSAVTFEGIVPKDLEIKYVRLLDENKVVIMR